MFTKPLNYNQNVNDVTVNVFYGMDTKRKDYKFDNYSHALYTTISWIEDDCEAIF